MRTRPRRPSVPSRTCAKPCIPAASRRRGATANWLESPYTKGSPAQSVASVGQPSRETCATKPRPKPGPRSLHLRCSDVVKVRLRNVRKGRGLLADLVEVLGLPLLHGVQRSLVAPQDDGELLTSVSAGEYVETLAAIGVAGLLHRRLGDGTECVRRLAPRGRRQGEQLSDHARCFPVSGRCGPAALSLFPVGFEDRAAPPWIQPRVARTLGSPNRGASYDEAPAEAGPRICARPGNMRASPC
jgi:hypothetical protein